MIFFLLSTLGLVPTFQTTKCKKLLNTTMERIKLLCSRREAQLRQLKFDLEKLQELGKEEKIQVWKGRIYKERELLSVYTKISAYCQAVQVKLKDIAGQNACPEGLEEPIGGLCFAASCCADLPELQELREIFAMKYDQRFVTYAQQLGRRCLVKEEESEKQTTAEDELKQGMEQALQQKQEQEAQVTVDSDECKQCPAVESLTQTAETMNKDKIVQVTAAMQDSVTATQVCDDDLGTTEVAIGLANRKKASEGRQTRCSLFKRACKRRQATVSSCNEEDGKVGGELAVKGQKDGWDVTSTKALQGDYAVAAHMRNCEAPNQHLVLYVKPPVSTSPPHRPPPPPPNQAPTPPMPPVRATSVPSSQYMKHETSYANAPLPSRCSTMAKINQYDQSYNACPVHPRLPKYEDLVANFTALKHGY
ncbi:hypothetical protein L7F22_038177 [Adiantum nelumboides]|nr:hypothetical protein [Adiantum nelumboides]